MLNNNKWTNIFVLNCNNIFKRISHAVHNETHGHFWLMKLKNPIKCTDLWDFLIGFQTQSSVKISKMVSIIFAFRVEPFFNGCSMKPNNN